MEHKFKIMCWAIDINLLLWIAVLSSVVNNEIMGVARAPIILGVVSSAVLQYWAYHDLNKEYRKQMGKE